MHLRMLSSTKPHLLVSKGSSATTRGVLPAKQESIHRCFVKPPEVFSYTPILDIA
jgi:hypothetical protein